MRIKILISSVLLDQTSGKMAGLAETVECDDDRAEYLVSIGAASEVDDEPEPEPEDDGDDESEQKPEPKKAAPAKPAAKPVTK